MPPSADLREILEKDAIRDFIQRSALLLDSEQFDAWLALFDPGGQYEMRTFGREIGADMTWWKSSRDELVKLLEDVPRQVRDRAQRLHLVTPVAIECSADRASARSHFLVVRTTTEGRTSVYAAGRYEDSLLKHDGRWLYETHRVMLDTRMLDTFTHVPL